MKICEERWKEEKAFGLPRCLDKEGNMAVFEARKNEMSLDCNNIPSSSSRNIILPHDIDCIFVPALAFDNFGRRLGQGGGYYDRFLKNCVNAVKVGVCFSVQISTIPLPESENDVSVDFIVCEEGLIRC